MFKSVHIESSNFMQTTAEEFTQQNDLHKNNTLFDTGFRGLLSPSEKQKTVFSV